MIAGKAIMCSLEWPNLSPLQVVHSHWSLWTFIPYLAMRLSPSSSDPPPSRPQHTSFPSQHLVFSPSHWRLMFTRSCYPPPPLWMIFVSNLPGPYCALTRMISELLIPFCHWNSLWIAKPVPENLWCWGWIGPEQLGILRPIQGVGNYCVGWVFWFSRLLFSTFLLIVFSIKWEASISIEMLPGLAHPHLFI